MNLNGPGSVFHFYLRLRVPLPLAATKFFYDKFRLGLEKNKLRTYGK